MVNDCCDFFGKRGTQTMEKWGALRTKKLAPILCILDKMHIAPSALTLASIPCLIGMVILLQKHVLLSLVFLLIHYVLDTLDGSLARYQKRVSQKGHLLDLCIDQMGVILFTLGLIWYELENPFYITWFVTMYIVVIAFSIMLNLLQKPAEGTIIGARHILYSTFYIQTIFHLPILQPILIMTATYETFVAFQLFRKLRCVT